MKKKFILFVIIILLFIVTGCKKGKIHKYEDFINYVDNMECNINKKEYSCDLKDKYEVISDRYELDYLNEKERIITFKIKNTEFTFEVISSYQCTGSLDGSCAVYEYMLTDNFKRAALSYYINQYNKKINHNDKYCVEGAAKTYCFEKIFGIKNYSDLRYMSNYLNGFLDYINQLDFKFVGDSDGLEVEFPEAQDGYRSYSVPLYFDIVDDKYVYTFWEKYKPIDNNIETYIKNYMNGEGIDLLGD